MQMYILKCETPIKTENSKAQNSLVEMNYTP